MDKKLFLGVGGMLAASAAWAQQRPNIIYIMCDDMGYGDLGCYGQQYIATPNIDRLASQGMRFTQAYAGSPVSAPSRACFMTGQHSGHTHVRGNREYWNNGNFNYQFRGENGNVCTDYSVVGQEPYDTDHVIIPEIFKKEGYATGMFGKWAGGYYNLKNNAQSSKSTPDKRGIDTFYGPICQFQAHTYYPNFLNRYDPKNYGDKHVVIDTLKQNIQHKDVASGNADYENREQYSADLIHRYALRWLDERAEDVQKNGTPFLGIFTYTLPHAELWQPRDSILAAYDGHFCTEKGGGGSSWYKQISNGHAQFAAMITRLDAMVGEIMAKLEEKGLADNTVLIFTSDNGPHEEGGADPDFFNRDGLLKGKKRSTYEGGIRVPFIVRWPGTVKAGSVSDHMFAFYDLMATFSDIAGIDNYKKYNPKGEDDYFDGISFYPTLTGQGIQEVHDHLYWEFHETNMLGVRQGNWKLVVSGGSVQGLFDLATDIHEDVNLASKYPEKVKELKAIIKQEHTNSNLFQVTIPN